jgi:hypothetical protein
MIGIIIIVTIIVAIIFYIFKKEIIELICVHVPVPLSPVPVLPLTENYEDAPPELPPMLCLGETCLEESDLNMLIIKSLDDEQTTTQPRSL